MRITMDWVDAVVIIALTLAGLGYVVYCSYWAIRNSIEDRMKKKKEGEQNG